MSESKSAASKPSAIPVVKQGEGWELRATGKSSDHYRNILRARRAARPEPQIPANYVPPQGESMIPKSSDHRALAAHADAQIISRHTHIGNMPQYANMAEATAARPPGMKISYDSGDDWVDNRPTTTWER